MAHSMNQRILKNALRILERPRLHVKCFPAGLHVRIGLVGDVMDYEYAPGPYRQEIGDIDWVSLTTTETMYRHVRVHDLKREDSLSFFMSTMASTPAAIAVIFINSEEHFRYIHVHVIIHMFQKLHVYQDKVGMIAAR